jgi:dimethylargininase
MQLVALTREVAPSLADCELTHLKREPIDYALAVEQHRRYEEVLTELGCTVRRLPPLPDLPDSVFVEDTAVVLQQLAIVTRPGAESRRAEVTSVADALREYRPLGFIEPPGTLDGGDVLLLGSTVYAGTSTRTNADGIQQLAQLASPHGYTVYPLTVSGCLHLKSAVTRVGRDVVLLNPEWLDASSFRTVNVIEVDPREPYAANAVCIGDTIIYATGFDRTLERLERSGIEVHSVDNSELQKAEGALTCCSILVES